MRGNITAQPNLYVTINLEELVPDTHPRRAIKRMADEALARIAKKALARDTGARALRAVLDEFMLNIMYDLPDQDRTGTTYIIDEDAVDKRVLLHDLPQRKQEKIA